MADPLPVFAPAGAHGQDGRPSTNHLTEVENAAPPAHADRAAGDDAEVECRPKITKYFSIENFPGMLQCWKAVASAITAIHILVWEIG